MTGWWLAGLALSTGYFLLIWYYWRNWNALPIITYPVGFQPKLGVSVIIPARNEGANIAACLQSLAACNYPDGLLEVIVIDDHSTDDTVAVVRAFAGNFPVRLITPVAGWGKKNAVTTGIQHATHPYIACTDADCEVPSSWLHLLAWVFETHNPKMIAGPVVFHHEKRLVEWFQTLDLLGLMGVTGAGIHTGTQHLANGANIAYPKSVFQDVDGYAGNDHIASGDDLFLAQKIARKWPGKIVFLKSPAAAVETLPMHDWPSFIQQRIRWGTKNAALPEWGIRLSLALVFLHSWAVVTAGIALLFQPAIWPLFLVLLWSKIVPDYFYLGKMSQYFQKKKAMRWFLPGLILHIIYIAGIGLVSLVKKNYVWKKREVKR